MHASVSPTVAHSASSPDSAAIHVYVYMYVFMYVGMLRLAPLEPVAHLLPTQLLLMYVYMPVLIYVDSQAVISKTDKQDRQRDR